MRGKWMDAMPEGVDAKTCKAVQGYKFCLRLLELEQAYDKLPAEERLRQHKEKSGPVLEAHRKCPSEGAPLCVSVSKKWQTPLFRGSKFGQPEVARICKELILQAKSTTREAGKAGLHE